MIYLLQILQVRIKQDTNFEVTFKSSVSKVTISAKLCRLRINRY